MHGNSYQRKLAIVKGGGAPALDVRCPEPNDFIIVLHANMSVNCISRKHFSTIEHYLSFSVWYPVFHVLWCTCLCFFSCIWNFHRQLLLLISINTKLFDQNSLSFLLSCIFCNANCSVQPFFYDCIFPCFAVAIWLIHIIAEPLYLHKW